jgi:hypothetical protein
MNSEQKYQRLERLLEMEQELQSKRDFAGLIKIHDEYLQLSGAVGTFINRIPQKAYCYARLGKKEEATQLLKEFSGYSIVIGQDEMEFTAMVLAHFIASDSVAFRPVQINNLKIWLQTPTRSEIVRQIVFDYEDFTGPMDPFDEARMQVRHSEFSDELLLCVFHSMQRANDITIYYNKETNDVLQETEGYLSSLMSPDPSVENRKLVTRITNFEPADVIIEGIHFEIPILGLTDFLDVMKEHGRQFPEIIRFLYQFENDIITEFRDFIDSTDDLIFRDPVNKRFYTELDNWLNQNQIHAKHFDTVYLNTARYISKTYLEGVNSEY